MRRVMSAEAGMDIILEFAARCGIGRPSVIQRGGGGPRVESCYGSVNRRSHRRCDAPAHAPARAREAEVRDGREALLVGAQREQQVRDAVAGGSLPAPSARVSTRTQ